MIMGDTFQIHQNLHDRATQLHTPVNIPSAAWHSEDRVVIDLRRRAVHMRQRTLDAMKAYKDAANDTSRWIIAIQSARRDVTNREFILIRANPHSTAPDRELEQYKESLARYTAAARLSELNEKRFFHEAMDYRTKFDELLMEMNNLL